MLSLKPALSEGKVKCIHEHSLDVLHTVGIDYKTPRALEILEGKGCQVDYDRNWMVPDHFTPLTARGFRL